MGEAIRKIPIQTGMIDPQAVPFGHSVFKTRISSAVITSTLDPWTLATRTPFYGRISVARYNMVTC